MENKTFCKIDLIERKIISSVELLELAKTSQEKKVNELINKYSKAYNKQAKNTLDLWDQYQKEALKLTYIEYLIKREKENA